MRVVQKENREGKAGIARPIELLTTRPLAKARRVPVPPSEV